MLSVDFSFNLLCKAYLTAISSYFSAESIFLRMQIQRGCQIDLSSPNKNPALKNKKDLYENIDISNASDPKTF